MSKSVPEWKAEVMAAVAADATVLRRVLKARGNSLTQAEKDVFAERRRQVSDEGWTPEHDDAHPEGALAEAGACYAMAFEKQPVPRDWPWEVNWWKPKDRRRNLERAAALIIAEIERLDRAHGIPATTPT